MNREKIKGILLILSGAAILAAPYLLRLVQEQDARMYVQEYEHSGDEGNPEKEKDAALFPQEGVIGMVEIPSLNLKLPVFEGAGAENLDKGIGHMTETAPLCSLGNSVCAGHNGSRKGVFFTYLCNIEEGAEVTVTTKNDVSHRYRVSEMRVVGPCDAWVTEESREEMLTLFTCSSHGTRRFAVKCVRDERDDVE